MVSRMFVSFLMLGCLLTPGHANVQGDLRQRAWLVLLDALDAGAPEDRTFAADRLGRIDEPRARDLLLSALNGTSAATRVAAANALRGRPQPAIVDALANALKREAIPAARMYLIEAIGGSGHAKAAELIGPSLRDPHRLVRLLAFSELGRVGSEGIALVAAELSAGNEENRREAATALGLVGGPAAVPWLEAALSDSSADVRREAAISLAELDVITPARVLEGFLAADTGDQRLHVAAALSRLGDRRGTDVLLTLVRDGDAKVRAQGAHLLSESRDPRAAEALVRLTERDDTPSVRTSAVVALARIGRGSKADRALLTALNDSDERTRFFAAKLLLSRGDRSGRPVLLAALRSADRDIRTQASEVAAEFVEPEEAQVLSPLISDEAALVRVFAIDAARRLRATSLLPEIQAQFDSQFQDVVAASARAIAEIGNQKAVPILRAALNSKRPPVRIAAAAELIRLLPAGGAQ